MPRHARPNRWAPKPRWSTAIRRPSTHRLDRAQTPDLVGKIRSPVQLARLGHLINWTPIVDVSVVPPPEPGPTVPLTMKCSELTNQTLLRLILTLGEVVAVRVSRLKLERCKSRDSLPEVLSMPAVERCAPVVLRDIGDLSLVWLIIATGVIEHGKENDLAVPGVECVFNLAAVIRASLRDVLPRTAAGSLDCMASDRP